MRGLMADRPLDLVVKNVRVVRPTTPAVETRDVGVQDGRNVRAAHPPPAAEPQRHYALAPFEVVMRAGGAIRAAHPRLAENVSVSLHCEMADILNAYTRLVQKDASLTGLAAYSAARPPHAEGLAVAVAAYLA